MPTTANHNNGVWVVSTIELILSVIVPKVCPWVIIILRNKRNPLGVSAFIVAGRENVCTAFVYAAVCEESLSVSPFVPGPQRIARASSPLLGCDELLSRPELASDLLIEHPQ